MGVAIPHLTKIGSNYYYRHVVPLGLRKIVGKRELKRGLETGDLSEATSNYCQLSDSITMIFQEARMPTDSKPLHTKE